MPDNCYPFISHERKQITDTLNKLNKILDFIISSMNENKINNTAEYCLLHNNEFKKLENLIYVYKKKSEDIKISPGGILSETDFSTIKNKYQNIIRQMEIKKTQYSEELSSLSLTSLRSNLFNVPESRYININS